MFAACRVKQSGSCLVTRYMRCRVLFCASELVGILALSKHGQMEQGKRSKAS